MGTAVFTTLTCGMGGASMRAVEPLPGVNDFILKFHAWTAMAVFILSVLLAYNSFKAMRLREERNRLDKILYGLTLGFLLLFAGTTFLAFQIR